MSYSTSMSRNKSAIASFVCALVGWILNLLLICAYFASTLLTVITFGLGGILYFVCCLPLAFTNTLDRGDYHRAHGA